MTSTSTPRRRGAVGLVERISAALDARTSRRGFLARTAVVGSALAVGPGQYLLRPGTAYAAVCGSDSACSSGYTVFCATINRGVNRCPPNALVGGWWKADNSGFCCGSARYYIDCHSFCSCGCGGGTHFCGEGCRSCSCGCGPKESCDQRKVCCNNFRYGQCRQDVSCTGPVWCRVVSCTPPWRVPQWACTTTSATDNRTATHTAPGIPYCTGIDRYYTAVGVPGGFLGEPVTGELPGAGGGARTVYDRGSIYWSPTTGAHEVHGAIRDAYLALRGDAGPLGYPTSDELPTADGRGRTTTFTGPGGLGQVVWRSDLGAHAVWGFIRSRWVALGAERGILGYPVTSEQVARDGVGRYNDFVGAGGAGSVYWHPTTGAHAVWGAIRVAWVALDRERGPLGYPTAEEQVCADGVGRFATFQGSGGTGAVYWSPASGAHAVYGGIRDRWRASGGETGPLGYPVTSEGPAAGGGRYNDFAGRGTAAAPQASVYWSPATAAHTVVGPVRRAWLAVGGSGGRLGFPTAEPVPASAGTVRAAFQHGSVLLDTATGATTITYT